MISKYFVITLIFLSITVNSYRVKQQHVQSKQGYCPRDFLRQKVCDLACDIDNDCPGIFKCCITDCGGRACVKPFDSSAKPKVSQTVPVAPKLMSLEPAKNILIETKPMQQQLSQLTAQNPQCPEAESTIASCSTTCVSDRECSPNQICCQVSDCSSKTCLDSPVSQPKAKKYRTTTAQQPLYDDYYEENNNNHYDDAYNGYGAPIKKKISTGFEGPLVNTQNGIVMAYQRNPLYKLEKIKYVQSQMPRYNMPSMPSRFNIY